jgi:hypothetical protein
MQNCVNEAGTIGWLDFQARFERFRPDMVESANSTDIGIVDNLILMK